MNPWGQSWAGAWGSAWAAGNPTPPAPPAVDIGLDAAIAAHAIFRMRQRRKRVDEAVALGRSWLA